MIEFTISTLPAIEQAAKTVQGDPKKLAALEEMTPEFEELLAMKNKSIQGQATQNGYGYWMGIAQRMDKEVAIWFAAWLEIKGKRDDLIGFLDGYGVALGRS